MTSLARKCGAQVPGPSVMLPLGLLPCPGEARESPAQVVRKPERELKLLCHLLPRLKRH